MRTILAVLLFSVVAFGQQIGRYRLTQADNVRNALDVYGGKVEPVPVPIEEDLRPIPVPEIQDPYPAFTGYVYPPGAIQRAPARHDFIEVNSDDDNVSRARRKFYRQHPFANPAGAAVLIGDQQPVAMQPAPVSTPFQARVEFEPITEVSLNRRQKAELINARVCNDSPNQATMDAERLIMSVGDMRVLTKTQAVWLLSQKRGQDWHVLADRWGVLGLAAGAAFSGVPGVAFAIPLYQQLMDIVKSGTPDITPFVAEMFPDSFTLQGVGQTGACKTGSMFVSMESVGSAFGSKKAKRTVRNRVQ